MDRMITEDQIKKLVNTLGELPYNKVAGCISLIINLPNKEATPLKDKNNTNK